MKAQKDKTPGVFRHEVKYYIGEREAFVLAQALRCVMSVDRHSGGDGQYWIRSLYFDTPDNRDYYDKINGCCERRKLRLRIYDIAGDAAMLELKSKHGAFVCKESMPLDKTDAMRLISGDCAFLIGRQSTAAGKYFACFRLECRRPVILIDYLRQAFELPFENIRVTIDRDLRASMNVGRLFDKSVPSVNVLDGGRCILEVKYRHTIPDFLRSILSGIGPPNESISKYILCRNTICY